MNTNGTQCYFCRKVLRNETVEQHAAQCGYVLEPCVNKCGAYIPRNTKHQHLQECRNTRLRSARSTESLLSATGYDTYPRGSQQSVFVRTGTLPRSYKPPTHSQPPSPSPYYQQQQTQYQQSSQLHNNNMVMDVSQKYEQLNDKFKRGHQLHNDSIRQLEFRITQLISDVKMVQSQNKTLVDWRTNVQYQLDMIVGEFRAMNANSKNDVNTHRLQELVKDLTQLRTALNSQQLTLKNEQVESRQFQNDIATQLKNCDSYFQQEFKKLLGVNGDFYKQIEDLTKENLNFNSLNAQLKVEIDVLRKDLEQVVGDCNSLVEKNKLQNAQIGDLKRSLAEINLNVEVTERSFENIQGLIATQPGRLVWKISDLQLKMDNAKANEKIPIKSPVFYTKDYGYRVRLVVHLNGLKKWRGRHMLACLHVMKGDYDDLLKWPCRVEANILLKDLENIEKPKDFVRYITAKRNYPDDVADDPQESSTQYMFIPHTTLLKSSHVKNNALFLEIVINNTE